MSLQALLWVPYLIGMAMLDACSIVVRAQLSEYLLVPILRRSLAVPTCTYSGTRCSSPGGYAASISRVSASIWAEGPLRSIAITTIAVFLRRINFIQEMIVRRSATDKAPEVWVTGQPVNSLAKDLEESDKGWAAGQNAPGDFDATGRCATVSFSPVSRGSFPTGPTTAA